MNTVLSKLSFCLFLIIFSSSIYSMEKSLQKRTQEKKSLVEQYPLFLQIRRFQNGNEASYILDGVTGNGDSYTLAVAKLKGTDQFYPFFGMKTCTNKRMRLYESCSATNNKSEVISIGLAAEYWKECKQIFKTQEAKTTKNNLLARKAI